MAKVNAKLTVRNAPLAGTFGVEYAAKLFGAEALADLPRYTRGPRAGMLKGYLIWIRCDVGGWSPYGVAYPNSTVRAWIGAGPYSPEGDALRGKWLGRIQNLCGSACVLGEANRASELARIEREAEEWGARA
jgi:hypothetical protein